MTSHINWPFGTVPFLTAGNINVICHPLPPAHSILNLVVCLGGELVLEIWKPPVTSPSCEINPQCKVH